MIRLDLTRTPELEDEGLARDVIRGIQEARREAGLAVSDRIRLRLEGISESARTALEAHQDLIAKETLATELRVGPLDRARPDGKREDTRSGWWRGAVDLGVHGVVQIALAPR